ncbi:hypothetical protein SPPR111872_15180 [Sphingobacterium prati]
MEFEKLVSSIQSTDDELQLSTISCEPIAHFAQLADRLIHHRI